jgi:flagellin-like hook-associated protein FlgL
MTGFSINNTIGQAAALRSLRELEQDIPSTQTRLSTGLKISSPRDDAAAFAVSTGLRNTIKTALGIREELDTGRGVLGVARTSAEQIGDQLKEMRRLVLEATGTTGQQRVGELALEFNARVAQIGTLIEQASYRGINLLDGSRENVSLASGLFSGNVKLSGFNFGGLKTVLEKTNIGATRPAEPAPGKFDELTRSIVAKVKETTGQVDETAIRDFANRFYDRVGRERETKVYVLGQLLVNSLGGTTAFDENNRRIVSGAIDSIRDGDDARANELIGSLVTRLTNAPTQPPPPPEPKTETLRVEFISESAGYKNVLGYYNRESGEGGILFPTVEAEGNNAPLQPGKSVAEFSVKAEDVGKIEYFLISDGASLNSSQQLTGRIKVTQATDGSYGIARLDAGGNVIRNSQGAIEFLQGRDARALFTETTKNAGGVDYASSVAGPTQTASTLAADRADGPTGIIAFEDIAALRNASGGYGAPGDADYNDAVFNVIRVAPPPPPNAPTTTLRATFTSESAGYRNVFGYYDTKTGEAKVLFGDVEAEGGNAPLRAGQSSVEFTVNSQDVKNIGYFLISDGASLNAASALAGRLKVVRGADGAFGLARADANGHVIRDAQGNAEFLQGQGARALFTERSKNAGHLDYASGRAGASQTRESLRSDTRDGPTGTIAFEDLVATRQSNGAYGAPGDADYNDAVFNIVIARQTVPGNGNGNGNGNSGNGAGNGGSGGSSGTGSTGGTGSSGGTGGTGSTGGTSGGTSGSTGGSGGSTSSGVTLSQVAGRVDEAIAQVEIGTAALAASVQQIDKLDSFVQDMASLTEATLGDLVKTDLQKDSALLVAQNVQQELGKETIGVTSKAAADAVQALFREPQSQTAQAREDGAALNRSAVVPAERPRPEQTEGATLQRSAILRVGREEEKPSLGDPQKLQRSAVLRVESPDDTDRRAENTVRHSAVVRAKPASASGARIDIST